MKLRLKGKGQKMKSMFVRKEQSSLKLAEKLEYNCGTRNFEIKEITNKEICEIVNSSCDVLMFEEAIFLDCFCELSNRLHWVNFNSGIIDVASVNPMTGVTVNYRVRMLSSTSSYFPLELFCEKHEENAIVNIFKTYMLTRHADSNLRVFDFFRKVGLYPNLNGYAYLVEAIKCVTYNPELLRNLTKGLYPLVGKKFGVSGSVVERGIRNAVDSMMNKGKFQETANGLFGGNFGRYEKPTNGEFISFLSLM